MLILVGISQEFQLQPPANVLAVLNTTTIIPCGPPISIPPAIVEWSKNFQLLRGDRFTVDGSNLTILGTQLSILYTGASQQDSITEWNGQF